MTRIPTGDEITIDDVDVHRLTAPRTNQPPIVLRYAGPVIDVLQGPTQNTWGPREMVLCDWYNLHRVSGDSHDAIATERSGLRPVDAKTTKPQHTPQRNRNGALVLRERQHRSLIEVPSPVQTNHGFVASGDYVCAVYETIEDMVIILADCRVSARDLDRMVDPSFYDRSGSQREASVEWMDVPGLSIDEMYDRLDAADAYLKALGEDPDLFADDLARVRDRVNEVEADQAEQAQEQDHRDRIAETMTQ